MLQMCLISLALQLSSAYDSIALYKPAWQLHPYGDDATFDASNAVDGLKADLRAWGGQCAISTLDKQTATWRVDLQDILSIRHITIYYRTENAAWVSTSGFPSRFLGFSLYVSNTTDRTQGKLCFHDTNYTTATIPAVLNVTCLVHGRYVIYYNERLQGKTYPADYSTHAYNELCEVEVYGCPVPGYYGPDCSTPCPDTCRYMYCHIETGACQGCKPGYHGHQCELQCGGLKYGDGCTIDCGACLDYKQCHHINGTCLQRCDAGFEGNLCKTACSVGFYGINCQGRCTINCGVPGRCNKTSGECNGGCQPGWRGNLCDTKCGDNQYGADCNQTCGKCREGNQCHHISGSCNDECEPGYRGNKCDKVCEFGYFGTSCKAECSAFCQKSRDCHHVTGYCTSGCKTGWHGNDCLEVEGQKQETDIRFYAVLGALCVILLLIGVYAVYKLVKWKRRILDKGEKYRPSDSPTSPKDPALKVHEGGNVNNVYQELGEMGQSSTYDPVD